jgi:hypothetical protein
MAIIPDSWNVEIGKIVDQGQPEKELPRPHLYHKLDMVTCASETIYASCIDRSVMVQTDLTQTQDTIRKIAKAKRAECVAQVVDWDCLTMHTFVPCP